MKKIIIKVFYKLIGLLFMGLLVHFIAEGLKQDSILQVAYDFFSSENFFNVFNDLLITGKRFSLGFLIAAAGGVPFGIALGRIKPLYNLFELPIEMLRPIPSAVVIPFGLVFIGIGETMKLFVIWFGAFWPMLIYTMSAAQNIDPVLIETARVFKISKFKQLFFLIIPAIIPQMIAGMRVAISIALLLAVTVEMIAAGKPEGIGFFIIDSERAFRHDLMLAGAILLAILGYIVNAIFMRLENFIINKRYGYLRSMEIV